MGNIRTIGQVAYHRPLAQLGMEELAARQRQILPSGGVLFARNVDGDEKVAARQRVLDLFAPERWPDRLHMLTLPSVQWRFERKLLATREEGWMRRAKAASTYFTGCENDRAIFYASISQMPGLHTPDAELKRMKPYPFAETGMKTRYASLFFANVDELMEHEGFDDGWDAAWLDYTGPLTVERLALIRKFYRTHIYSTLIVTSLKSRFNQATTNAVARAGGHSEWLRKHLDGEILHDFEYFDSSSMAQFAVKKTVPKILVPVFSGPETPLKENEAMTSLNQEQGSGISGAKRSKWRTTNFWELYRRISNENPKADKSTVDELFWEEVEDDKNYQRAIVQYAADNAHRSLNDKREKQTRPVQSDEPATRKRKAVEKMAEVATATSKIKDKLKQRVVDEARILLLKLEMPNGKTLGQCTGPELSQIGGWCSGLAKLVPARKCLTDVASEDQVWAVWKKQRK